MADPITTLIDAASQTEDVLFGLQRAKDALFLCHENFSSELPRAEEGKKLEPWMYEDFAGRAETYFDMLFALLENLDIHITELGAITYGSYEAASKAKEETPHD